MSAPPLKEKNLLPVDAAENRIRPSTAPAPTWDDYQQSSLSCCWESSHLNNAIPFLRYLSMNAFWFRVLYALRLAFVGVLPIALLAYHENTKEHWIFPSIMITFCIVAAHASVSQSLAAFVGLCRSLVFQLVLVEIALAIDSRRHWAGWGALFAGVIVLVAFTSSGLVTKMTLFAWSVFMVVHWKREDEVANAEGPAEFMKQNVLASAFGLFVSFFPFPYFDTWKAETAQRRLSCLVVRQLYRLQQSIWTDNLTRSALLVNVRELSGEISAAEETFLTSQERGMTWEFFFVHRWRFLCTRQRVLHHLVTLARSMAEVLENVHLSQPERWDGNSIFHSMRDDLEAPMVAALSAISAYLFLLTRNDAETGTTHHKQMLERAKHALVEAAAALDTALDRSRARHIYPLLDDCVSDLETFLREQRRQSQEASNNNSGFTAAAGAGGEERTWFASHGPYQKFPFLSFQGGLVYPWRESIVAVAEYDEKMEMAALQSWTACLCTFLWFPVRDLLTVIKTVRDLFRGDAAAIAKLIASLKVSFAMTSAVALLFYLNAQDPAHGAVIIGFVMDASPTNNLIAGMQFLLGCVFGSVYGFLCQTVTRNFTESMIWITVITFTTGLGSCGPVHGEVIFFIQFFALSAMAPGTSETGIIRAIQQNVGAIAWLVIVCNVIFPQFASNDLHHRSLGVLVSTRKFFHRLIESLFDAEDAQNAEEEQSPLMGASRSTPTAGEGHAFNKESPSNNASSSHEPHASAEEDTNDDQFRQHHITCREDTIAQLSECMQRAHEAVKKLEGTTAAAANEPTISLEAFASKPFQNLSLNCRVLMAHFEVLIHATATVLNAPLLFSGRNPQQSGMDPKGKTIPMLILRRTAPMFCQLSKELDQAFRALELRLLKCHEQSGGGSHYSSMLDGVSDLLACDDDAILRHVSRIRRQCTAIKETAERSLVHQWKRVRLSVKSQKRRTSESAAPEGDATEDPTHPTNNNNKNNTNDEATAAAAEPLAMTGSFCAEEPLPEAHVVPAMHTLVNCVGELLPNDFYKLVLAVLALVRSSESRNLLL